MQVVRAIQFGSGRHFVLYAICDRRSKADIGLEAMQAPRWRLGLSRHRLALGPKRDREKALLDTGVCNRLRDRIDRDSGLPLLTPMSVSTGVCESTVFPMSLSQSALRLY